MLKTVCQKLEVTPFGLQNPSRERRQSWPNLRTAQLWDAAIQGHLSPAPPQGMPLKEGRANVHTPKKVGLRLASTMSPLHPEEVNASSGLPRKEIHIEFKLFPYGKQGKNLALQALFNELAVFYGVGATPCTIVSLPVMFLLKILLHFYGPGILFL